MAQCNIEALANQFEKEMFLSDDSETDDESDKDYESYEDKAIKPERQCVIRGVRGKEKYFIKCMWKTVLNHERGYMPSESLATTTLLVCTINGVHKPIITCNDSFGHAEDTLITYLKTNYKGPMKLTIYINNSPCASCAGSLKDFLETNLNIQLTLHVTHLYNIIRKSCKLRADAGKAENHIKWIREKHEKNYSGLRDLMSLGGNRCRIESFTKEVWEALLAVMDMSEESRKRIMRVYGLKLENYDRSRQGEDRRIRKDLNHIKSHSDPWHDINKNDLEDI